MRIEYHPEADEELLASARYYEERVEGLGTDFLTAVERATSRIAQFPQGAVTGEVGIRKKLLLGFPFAILYSHHQDAILILAVMHLHRRPGYWKNRMPK